MYRINCILSCFYLLSLVSECFAYDEAINTPRAEFAKAIRDTEPLTPEQERRTFQLPPGFEAELVVAEPQIAKPMNMAFDARGRLWISSSLEYPYAAPLDQEGKDFIVVMEDTNSDGRYDKSTRFAEGLNIPMGLYPYKDGVICFSIPNIWFLRDTDNDGKADQREVLYGPMGYERDTHGMCNGFTRGYDGWLYACHGFNNHTNVSGRDGHSITMQSGNTFRMQTNGDRIEHYSHGLVNPFGMAQSPVGDLFVADCHTKPISFIIPGGYYESFGKPHNGLGYVPNVMNHLHGSTAIGGIAQYNARQFPEEFFENTFGGNVMTSSINRNRLEQHGGSYRAVAQPDLLVSGDPWFRPVDLQLGPDGALYVADFYNRIIGHYEVKLDHPGRDRHRGRVWRIVYRGDKAQSETSSRIALNVEQPEALIEEFAASNQTRRMLALDELSDQHPVAAAKLAKQALTDSREHVRACSLWLLHRLGKLEESDLVKATQDSSDFVKQHAYRVIAARNATSDQIDQAIVQGFKSSEMLARRAALYAAKTYPNEANIDDLIHLYFQTPDDDVHVRHVIRMALLDHFYGDDWFKKNPKLESEEAVKLIAGICLAISSDGSGKFLASHLDQLKNSGQLPEYVRHAILQIPIEDFEATVSFVRENFQGNRTLQAELLRSAHAGLRQRGLDIPETVYDWAIDLASQYLGYENGQVPSEVQRVIAWEYLPYPGQQDRGNPFTLSTRRTSSDGMVNTPLVSTHPSGENRTGIYRSTVFQLNEPLSFYMAGHDGYPGKPINGLNVVRLRDASTHKILQSCSPPRNDVAQLFEFNQEELPRQVYVEIVDGDSASAYAWLAVGRWSNQGLNGHQSLADQRLGIGLVREFELKELQSGVSQLLLVSENDPQTRLLAADTLVVLHQQPLLHAVAAAINIPGVSSETQDEIKHALLKGETTRVVPILEQTMSRASSVEQAAIAEYLYQSVEGAAILIGLVESGKASPRLLQNNAIRATLNAHQVESLTKRLDAIVQSLPSVDEGKERLIAQRKERFLNQTGNADSGQKLFEKNCMTCHQLQGKGKKVGPNLDGIGNRGLDRLCEDILAPNRNVDVAFRSMTIVLESGKVINGLSKGKTGAQLIIVDSKGEETSIPVDEIEDEAMTHRSLMPDNLGDVLSEDQFVDLLLYMLTLKH